MNEDQRKWLLDLQEKGIKFEFDKGSPGWVVQQSNFSWFRKDYRIPTQPIPDIPGWRDLCWEMQSKGVEFENVSRGGMLWCEGTWEFITDIEDYRIPQQPIPEWSNEEMTEETKPDPREEIPHREQQIQWHEDKIHSLETGEPMREWEYMEISKSGKDIGWYILGENPRWLDYHKYRRKPRTVTYWHCLYRHTSGFHYTECALLGAYNNMEEFKRAVESGEASNKVLACFEQTVELAD